MCACARRLLIMMKKDINLLEFTGRLQLDEAIVDSFVVVGNFGRCVFVLC